MTTTAAPDVDLLEQVGAADPGEPADAAATTGAASPQPDGSVPASDALPLRPCAPAALHVVGAHGGAGEDTVAALVAGARPTGHAWPTPDAAHGGGTASVVLVARTHAAGLLAARAALAQWADGRVPGVRLAGLVLVADAPGRLPRPLAQLAQRVAGGAPRTWRLGWQEAWRLAPPAAGDLPRDARALARALAAHTTPAGAPPAVTPDGAGPAPVTATTRPEDPC